MNRIYYPYWKWEEVKFNMWGDVDDKDIYYKRAFDLMCNCQLFGEWMNRVVVDWSFSCKHNLSNIEQNRRAWLGQAAVSYAIQCPEYITRAAWNQLSDLSRICANNQANISIKMWEEKCQNVQSELMF